MTTLLAAAPAGTLPHLRVPADGPGRLTGAAAASPPSTPPPLSAGTGEGLQYLHLRPPPHLVDRAERELGETDARRSAGLAHLVAAQHEAATAAVAPASTGLPRSSTRSRGRPCHRSRSCCASTATARLA